jgi:hypothetical protein
MATIKVILVVIVLSMILFLGYNQMAVTGFNTADVSIKEKMQGQILMNYFSNVNLTSSQNVTVEFTNTGTGNYSARIEMTVYFYNTTTLSLEQLATYQDNYAFLNPGERKSFSTVFIPTKLGTYYIKARVPFGSMVNEGWGSFFVTYYFDMSPEVKFIATSYGGGFISGQREFGVSSLELSYNTTIDTYPGQKLLLPIKLINTGTVNLHGLKFYSSTTENINFDVNPKEIYQLTQNESNLFLVSLEISNNTQPGKYDFYFQILGIEIKRAGSITLNVESIAKSIKDEVYNDIINYEYLITDINYQIYLTQNKGFNTTNAELYLDDAIKSLQEARNYYDQGNYEQARNLLDRVKKDLEKVVLELAAVTARVYTYPAFDPYLILLLLIIILIALIIFLYLRRKRSKRRPKLIRSFTEEEGT